MPRCPADYPISYYSCFQIMLLTDPEVESSLLISLDEGASYQKYGLAFEILSLLFHPEQEDWILAYSHEQKVKTVVAPSCMEPWKPVHVVIQCESFSQQVSQHMVGEKKCSNGKASQRNKQISLKDIISKHRARSQSQAAERRRLISSPHNS